MAVPRICEVIRSFKDECPSAGWKTSENEDWVYADKQYHNFLWIRTIHPSTLKRITKASKCAVREGISYRVVDVAFTAWLLLETPPEELIHLVMEDENLSKKIALYDMSDLDSAAPICTCLNTTESSVFKGFEDFLRKKWGVKFKSAQDVVTAEI